MNRNVPQQAGALPALKKLLTGAVIGAALAAMPLAHAATKSTTLTFEAVQTDAWFGQFDGGESMTESGYLMTAFSNSETGYGGFSGQLISLANPDPGASQVVMPVGHDSTYYAAFNDSELQVQAVNGGSFRLQSVEASFIYNSNATIFPSATGYLGFSYLTASGVYGSNYALMDSYNDGTFSFSTFNTSNTAMGTTDLVALSFFAYSCNIAGSCSAFQTDKGQFATDNIVLTSAVPEPSSYAMMLLGLAGVGAAARRRNRGNGRAA